MRISTHRRQLFGESLLSHALVFAGVDVKGGNILEYKETAPNGVHVIKAPLADGGYPCPSYCPVNPDLDPSFYIWNS